MRYTCASAHVNITPIEPIPLAGFGARTQAWQAVASPLEANAILLSDDRTRVLFVSADLLYFGARLASVLERHAEKFGIAAECLILSASHTHFAPAAERTKSLLGAYDEEFNRFLEKQLIHLIDTVMSTAVKEVTVRASRAATDLNINRRRRWLLPTLTRKGLRMPPNVVRAPTPDGPMDSFIDALQFLDAGGKAIGAVWKFASHPVNFPERLCVSAEFPGRVRSRLRQLFGNDTPIVFWQGFAGDVRPRLSGKPSWKDRIRALRAGPSFVAVSIDQWQEWSDRVADALISALRDGGYRALSGELSISSTGVPLSLLLDEDANPQIRNKSMLIQRLAFGEDIVVLFFGAEVCSPYLQMLGADARTICVGYTGDVFGYLPSEGQVREGGYEGGDFLSQFGLVGPMRAGFERAVLEAVRRLGGFSPAVAQSDRQPPTVL